MSYTKTIWVDDSSPDMTAENLNHIEQGIYDAHQGLMPEAPTDNKTYGRKNGAWSEVVTDVEWGDIGGDITEQTDLQTALGGKVDTSSMSAYRTATAEDVINATKVDKIEGKGLSTEDFTSAEKSKLSDVDLNNLKYRYVSEATSLPQIGESKSVNATLSEQGEIYNTTGNFVDLYDLRDGTYTGNGLTITIDGNRITINGTTTSATYIKLSEGVEFNNSHITQRTVNLPNVDMALSCKLISGTGRFSLCIRSKVSGNIVTTSTPDVEGQFAPFTPITSSNIDDMGSLYLFINNGRTFTDLVSDIALQYSTSAFISEVDTVKYTNAVTATMTSKGCVLANKSGTYTEFFSTNIPNSDTFFATKRNKIYVEKTATKIDLTIPASSDDKYVKYSVVKFTNASSNADGWATSVCELLDTNKNNICNITNTGEWDMAVKIHGAPDFIGVRNHGSEVQDGINIFIDGTPVLESEALSGWYNIVQLVYSSKMYDPTDETTHVANHKKVLTLDGRKRTYTIENRIEWLVNTTTDRSYLAMLPIQRTSDDAVPIQVTDIFYDSVDYVVTDCSTTTFNPSAENDGVSKSKHNVTSYAFKGEQLNIYGYVKVIRRKELLENSESYVSNAQQYNKVYIDYCGANHSVSVGDIWAMETEIFIDSGKVSEVTNE